MLLLSAALLLTALGFAALLSRADPLRDTPLFVRFVEGVLLGLVAAVACSLVDFRRTSLLRLRYLPLVAAFGLSLLLLVFGSGPGSSTAKVNLGPVQPIEAIRLLLALFLAGYFARTWELLRQVHDTTLLPPAAPSWLRLPRIGHVLPVLGGVGLALVFFFLQKDLGPALMLTCVFLALYAVARGGIGAALAGTAVLVAGFYAGYRLHCRRRWRRAWRCGRRRGTTPCAAAIRWRTRCGRSPPAGCSAPASVSGRRGICRPARPISRWPRSARSSG